ncbi:hypothetical protein D3C80_1717210 [compost metagenome]
MTKALVLAEIQHQVHQFTIIGHIVADIGMWPVRSPQHPIGRCLNQSPGKGDSVIEWPNARRNPLRTANLDPG